MADVPLSFVRLADAIDEMLADIDLSVLSGRSQRARRNLLFQTQALRSVGALSTTDYSRIDWAVGQQAALALTSALPQGSVCEIDVNANQLRNVLCGPVLAIENGQVKTCTEPGLVMPPLPDMLDKFLSP